VRNAQEWHLSRDTDGAAVGSDADDGAEGHEAEEERVDSEPRGRMRDSRFAGTLRALVPEELAAQARPGFLKDAFEGLRARARYLRNMQAFYKWSIAAGLTGFIAGVGAIVFTFLLDSTADWFEGLVESLPHPYLLALVPAVGGLAVGLIRYVWVPEAFQTSGAMDAMIDSVHSREGRIKTRMPFATMVTSAITLGSGGSAGREGPTVWVGAGLGSLTGQLIEHLRLDRLFKFELKRSDVRTLAICGAAAGLGAIFRAPIGGALFAASVLYMYGMEMDTIMPSTISAVTSYLVYSVAYGFEPLFRAPTIWSFNFFDLVVVVIIGVVASVVGVVYVKVFYGVFKRFRELSLPDWLKPAIGGLVVGVLVVFAPRLWGIGHETIQDAIDYEIGVGVLLVLLAGKAIASSFTIGSGGSGGDLAPALFIGAALGGTIGQGAVALFPDAAVHPSLYVIAGMGALYASVGKLPLSTAILLSESTRNFTMVIPLIVANTAGYLASGAHTIYESQHGDADREKADVLRRVPVGDIYQPDVVTAPAAMSVIDLLRLIGDTRHHGFPVLGDEGDLAGVVSWKDARDLPYEQRQETTVGQIMTSEPITLTPLQSSRKALDLLDLHHIGRIVVVDPEDPKRVLGIVTREDVIRTYAALLHVD
jgi:CIC family chloride channel protein